jgi:hypothetical protein
MSHYAQVIDGRVTQVIVVERDVLNTGIFGDPNQWIQTSYNTHGGQHLLGGTPLRKNFAGVGFVYDPALDAFYPPQPYPSWLLDSETCFWHAPVAQPQDGKYYTWDESIENWKEIEL